MTFEEILRHEVERLKTENAHLKDAVTLLTKAFVQIDDERDADFALSQVSDAELKHRLEKIRQTD